MDTAIKHDAPMLSPAKLPLPRLQLTWEEDEIEGGWICYYELLVPPQGNDPKIKNPTPFISALFDTIEAELPYIPPKSIARLAKDCEVLKLPGYIVWPEEAHMIHDGQKISVASH